MNNIRAISKKSKELFGGEVIRGLGFETFLQTEQMKTIKVELMILSYIYMYCVKVFI